MSIKAKIIQIIEAVSSSLWFIPLLFVLSSFLLTYGSIYFDTNIANRFSSKSWLFFSAGAESARAVLSTIAGSMITIAGVVFSITIVVLSLASSQYGPRLLDGFMKDKINQIVLGVFIATFLYSILILKTITSNENGFIPHYSINISILLSIFSVLFFIYFIHHTCKSIQASSIIDKVCIRLNGTIENFEVKDKIVIDDTNYQLDESNNFYLLKSSSTGYVQYIDYNLLKDISEENEIIIKIDLKPGAFCPATSKIGSFYSKEKIDDSKQEKIETAVLHCFNIGLIRTYTQDIEYGFHQLVEVALRALSPGINDPFTAILCLDRIASNLLDLLSRELPSGYKFNNNKEVVLIYKTFDYAGIVETAFRQIRQASSNSLAVRIRVLEVCSLIIDNVDNKQAVKALKVQIAETKDACSKMNLSDLELKNVQERL